MLLESLFQLYSQSVRLGICSLGGFCRRIQDTGYMIHDTRYRIRDTGYKIHSFPMCEGTIMFPRVVTYNLYHIPILCHY